MTVVLVKRGRSQTLLRMHKVLSEFHTHVQAREFEEGVLVFAQASSVDSAWSLVTFAATHTAEVDSRVYVRRLDKKRPLAAAVNLDHLAPMLDQNYRTSQDYVVCPFHSVGHAVVRVMGSSSPNSTLTGTCHAERLRPDHPFVLDEPVLPPWVCDERTFRMWRLTYMPSFHMCVLKTNKDDWDSACKSLAKACTYVDISYVHGDEAAAFRLQGVMTEDVTQPRLLMFTIDATHTSTSRAPDVFRRDPGVRETFAARKVRVAVRSLHKATHHQGPVRERHSRLYVQWLPCEGFAQSGGLTPKRLRALGERDESHVHGCETGQKVPRAACHVVFSTVYDTGVGGNELSIALRDVSERHAGLEAALCPQD